ncbi:MAG: tetratricopeptide repeat protein [Syntrophobacterales bacterium]
MRRAINYSCWPPLLVFLLIFAAVMAPGCQSLHQFKEGRTDDHWICPEYADVPLRKGRFGEAIEQHLQVISQEPENGLAHYHLGYAYGQLGLHPDEIAQYLEPPP